MEITNLTLCELSEKLESGKLTSVQATEACLDRIKNTERLNNFVTVCDKLALESAKKADEARARGAKGKLLGVPIAVKDNISTQGVRTTCASRFLSDYVPPYDATVVKKLKDAGAIVLGKTNMDEFAMGSTNENSAFGAVKNVRDENRVPGGSSGGSANCVAADQAFASLGSDTGGSIRQPASYCGVVGLKPTYSAVSRNGLVAFASSLDQIGVLSKSCDDALVMLEAIVGKDPFDSTSAEYVGKFGALDGNVDGITIGVADEFASCADKGVLQRANAAITALESMGAKIKRVSVKSFDAALAVYYVLSSAEASSNLARFDGVKYGNRAKDYKDVNELYKKSRTEFFGAEVKRRIMLGNYVLSSGYYDAYYLRASKLRTVIKREFDAILSECDCILSPTAPTVAPCFGEQSDPAKVYLSDIYTVPVNICGLPAVSVPFGMSDGLPVGVQLIGKAFGERRILNTGKALEKFAKEIR